MAPPGGSRESLVPAGTAGRLSLRCYSPFFLTVVAVVVLFMVRHVLLVLLVSVLFRRGADGAEPDGFASPVATSSGWPR